MRSRVRFLGVITAFSLVVLALLSCRDGNQTGEDSTVPTAVLAAKPALIAATDNLVATDSAPLTDVEPTLTIVYTNNIDGEIEPCG